MRNIRMEPPELPLFLAGMFELKTVDGVPNDEEVKLVHAAIRALDNVANMPTLYDPNLAMGLSQHLFDLQMARYRNQYPCTIFTSQSTTYVPPALPAHIPVTLEEIVGRPSDAQVQLVRTALRFSESSASMPSIFDADLDMKLSQHLFDIQFERYLRRATSHDSETTTQPLAERSDPIDTSSVNNSRDLAFNAQHDSEDGSNRDASVPPVPSGVAHDRVSEAIPESSNVDLPLGELPRYEHTQNEWERTTTKIEETNQILNSINDSLKDTKRILVASQNAMAKGWNVTSFNKYGSTIVHSLINEVGECPESVGLPSLVGIRYNLFSQNQLDDATLAQYLRFYNLDDDNFIEEGEVLGIKADKKGLAITKLQKHLRAY